MVENITFSDGDDSRNISVRINNDQIAESVEQFEVFLKLLPDNPFDVRIGEPDVAIGTIYDDEVPSKILCIGLAILHIGNTH